MKLSGFGVKMAAPRADPWIFVLRFFIHVWEEFMGTCCPIFWKYFGLGVFQPFMLAAYGDLSIYAYMDLYGYVTF